MRFEFCKSSVKKKEEVAMLMSDGPWSPEHIYQEIVGYGKTWHRGGIFNWAVKYHKNRVYHFVSNLATFLTMFFFKPDQKMCQ